MSSAYRIRLDASDSSVLIVCSCGYRDICTNRETATRIAVDHERHVHPDQRQAYYLAWAATRRHSGE